MADPPLGEAGLLLRTNRSRLPASGNLLGQPWPDLRRLARQSAIEAAHVYMAGHGEPLPRFNFDGPFFLAGHQPELFHPGVWVKNFALCGLARTHHGTALNLIVDNDTVKQTSLRLPHPPEASYPYLATVPFDHWNGEIPWEERTIHDPLLFARCADQVASVLRPWGYEPLVRHTGQRCPVSFPWTRIRGPVSRQPGGVWNEPGVATTWKCR